VFEFILFKSFQNSKISCYALYPISDSTLVVDNKRNPRGEDTNNIIFGTCCILVEIVRQVLIRLFAAIRVQKKKKS
jgi:hypothetical protein